MYGTKGDRGDVGAQGQAGAICAKAVSETRKTLASVPIVRGNGMRGL